MRKKKHNSFAWFLCVLTPDQNKVIIEQFKDKCLKLKYNRIMSPAATLFCYTESGNTIPTKLHVK